MSACFSSLFHAGEWSCPTETGTKPPPLTWFTFTKVDKRRAVVYGGYTGEGLCGDAYVLELDKWVCEYTTVSMCFEEGIQKLKSH